MPIDRVIVEMRGASDHPKILEVKAKLQQIADANGKDFKLVSI